MTDKLLELRRSYGRLKAFAESMPQAGNVNAFYAHELSNILSEVENALGQELKQFDGYTIRTWGTGQNSEWCDASEVRTRASQLAGFLQYGYNVEEKFIETASLYQAIHDRDLRERCGDLILGPGPFDRVINQATLVLEDRIRNRAGLDRSHYGPGLVNAAIKSDPAEALIVFSSIKAEQEGYANIIRGLMQALRNETHHSVADTFSREDALSICGFIDRILRLIDQSAVNK